MPFVHLTLFNADASDRDVEALQHGLTDLMAKPMRKKRELTIVSVETSPAHVALGGTALAGSEWTGQLTAFVTAGTNTADEKAAFQREAHALLVQRFGPPAAPLYVIVQEVPGPDWGYGGLSQAARARAVAAA